MDADLVLRWMSEMGAGSVRDLRERVAWIARTDDTPVTRAATGRWLRDVAALAHAEVDWDSDRWAIAPAVIARLPAADGTAVLAGARRAATLDALESSDVAVLCWEQQPASGDLSPPSAVFIQYDDADGLRQAAADADARYAGCAALNISECLPPLRLGSRAAPPARTNTSVERLTCGEVGVRFGRAEPTDDGLYRVTLRGRYVHLYRRDGQWYHCDLPTGVFIEHARAGTAVMRWRPERESCYGPIGTMFIDWGAPLPALHARALTLCSGLAPRFSGAARTAIYCNVPKRVAGAVAESLSQTLQHI